MGKKISKLCEAIFVSLSELFSIHTFEVFARLTAREYTRIKNNLFNIQNEQKLKGGIYKEKSWKGKGERYRCSIFKKSGIRITLEKNCNKEMEFYIIRIIVNPRKLIDPHCPPVGIFIPEKANIKKVAEAFNEVLKDTDIPNDLNWYKLSRIDRCVNIYCDNQRLFRELVRVLRKLPTPPKYERKYHVSGDRKADNRYNKHSICFACKTRELIIYDKTYQIIENGIVVDYEDLPQGVLRFEVHEERERIRKVEKEHPEFTTQDILWHFVKTSEEKIPRAFSQCFSEVPFLRIEKIYETIEASRYSDETKTAMRELAHQLQRKQSVDKALSTLEKQKINTAKLLDKFENLGISPVPLRENFCAESIPGPAILLKEVAAGELKVKYVKTKHR